MYTNTSIPVYHKNKKNSYIEIEKYVLILIIGAVVLLSFFGIIMLIRDMLYLNTTQEEFFVAGNLTDTQIVSDVPFIDQNGTYPTGCESVSATMALQYLGVNITVDDFISELPKTDIPEDGEGASPWEYFIGNPYSNTGYGCYAPVIESTVNYFLSGLNYTASDVYGVTLETLCEDYIVNDIPVILWATIDMKEVVQGPSWTLESGEEFTWLQPEHSLLLVGFDDNYYYFNDPLNGAQVGYEKALVETAYIAMGEQAVIFEV